MDTLLENLPVYNMSRNSAIKTSLITKCKNYPLICRNCIPIFISHRRRLYTKCKKEDEQGGDIFPIEKKVKKSGHQCGLAEAARYVRNDAMVVSAAAQNIDERARNDLILLARNIYRPLDITEVLFNEFSRLDMRARQDMALIGSTVIKLDARARARAERKVGRFGRIANKLKERAGTELKLAATEHWNDGALEADLRLADIRARRRALEDSFATFQAVKSIHNAAVKVLLMKAKSQNPSDILTGEEQRSSSIVDQIAEFEEAYLSMASLLADTNYLEQSDPDELEFIIAALLDLDEVQSASGSSLVTEISTSPDTATRRALVDALANAPSFWTLGNAGISALQRLTRDENPDVSNAALKALDDLKDQMEQMDGSTFFNNLGNDKLPKDGDSDEDLVS